MEDKNQTTVTNPPQPSPVPTQTTQSPKPKAKSWLVIGGVALVVIVISAVGALAYRNFRQPKPTTYEECLATKGSLIQESYPATCVTKSGQRFVQPLSDEQKARLKPSTASQSKPDSDLAN